MNKWLMSTAIVLGMTGGANANAIFCGPATEGGACEPGNEVKVFLEDNKDTMLGFGNPGTQTATPIINFQSTGGALNMFMDFANGFGTITPTQGQSTFNGIDVTIPGFTFSDLVFDVQLTPSSSAADQFTITPFDQNGIMTNIGNMSDAADTDKQFSVVAGSGAFSEVDLASLTGFDEIKHIEISGIEPIPGPVLGVPDAPTWVTMFAGFGVMAWLKRRRNHNALA